MMCITTNITPLIKITIANTLKMRGDVKYGAIILAGGKSSRMDYPKPWLLDRNGNTFMKTLAETYKSAGCEQIVGIVNTDFCHSKWMKYVDDISDFVLIVENTQVNKGRFYSVKLAIEHLSELDFVYLQNVDNPLTNKSLLELLMNNRIEEGLIIPSYNGKGGHPILLSAKIINDLKNLEDNQLILRDVLSTYIKKYLPVPWEYVLTNINTPTLYNNYLEAKKGEWID